jgi:hypothetical protein
MKFTFMYACGKREQEKIYFKLKPVTGTNKLL